MGLSQSVLINSTGLNSTGLSGSTGAGLVGQSEKDALMSDLEPPDIRPPKGDLSGGHNMLNGRTYIAIKLSEIQAGGHPLVLLTCVR